MNNEIQTTEPEDIIYFYQHWKNSTFEKEEDNLDALFKIFKALLENVTLQHGIMFPTLFSRLAFIGQENRMDSKILFYAHAFRRCTGDPNIPISEKIKLGQYVITNFFNLLWKEKYNTAPEPLTPNVRDSFRKKKNKVKSFHPVMYGVITNIDPQSYTFDFIDENGGEMLQTAFWNVADKNDLFSQNLQTLLDKNYLPMTVNLLEVEVSTSGELYPRGIVIQPDFLIDATAIAECFKDASSHAELYILNKLRPPGLKIPILIGNITNYILDYLFLHEDASITEIAPSIFQKFGLTLAVLEDNQMKEAWKNIQTHFHHIKKTIQETFKTLHIQKENSYLEPSFYAQDYGIQGRLDLWSVDANTRDMTIVELKSGSVFRPNVYGINNSHFIQTQIYEMLLRSAFGKKVNFIKNYIFYSKEKSNNIRFAPFVKLQVWEILTIRNNIVFYEEELKRLTANPGFLDNFNTTDLDFLDGFTARNADEFQKYYQALSKLEKSYFIHFLSFIAREYALSKTGIHGIENAMGNAALWLETVDEKKDRYAILTGLKIIENRSFEKDATLVMEITDATQVSNFRQGDIVVLYPQTGSHHAPLQQQLYKCSISKLQGPTLELRLRNTQMNTRFFEENEYWNIEEDLLDSSFHKLNETLTEFIMAPVPFRNLFLGLTNPGKGKELTDYDLDIHLTNEQNDIVLKALSSEDFFLIWGPPGTGKTSTVLRKITQYLEDKTSENVLILAYTNRAVDEICDAITDIFELKENAFIRIGSKISSRPDFHALLLDSQLEKCSNRYEVRQLMKQHRVFVSTVSSMLGKPELFYLKSFDTIIIDEASQILEPYLCGILQKGKRRILIGDHKQLPAVVQQENTITRVHDQDLVQAGIVNLSNSLFERLFKTYQKNGWNHAYGILTYQGRMHAEIQHFVNQSFYENKLRCLVDYFPEIKTDYKPLYNPMHNGEESRVIFVDNRSPGMKYGKVNLHEADICVNIILHLEKEYASARVPLTPMSIGVITPFRAQITQIKKKLEALHPELASLITVDTVERYQGGARDIIIISSCIQNYEQLKRVTSYDSNGVDRKLNVALTRAKEQIIMIGNKDILSRDPLYKSWISQSLEL